MNSISWYLVLSCLIAQTMVIDESVLCKSFSDVFKDSTYIELNMSNSVDSGLTSYDYCTVDGMAGQYHFLGFPVEKIAAKIEFAKDKNFKEILVILKVWDAEPFYKKVVRKYGMPNTSGLSKFYLEKHGFKIPVEVHKDSLDKYYEQIPKPEVKDFHEIQSLAWYDINKKNNCVLTDLLIKNRTNPANNFQEKEIWVSFKRAR
ncbi:hypothetical protein GUA46_01620 [Muricauda sp. HICW]|uniref:Uncharacterized protein n=1 Tax=Flagellimonas chongwuensis TaxID=2697365 RepID=A0A850NEZ4_9FLAO|nr:hypothetical protein [Allomuricauda chongwuensis]NVN17025.1 hypothetical protein [Allomuricauda chongwuensis]